MNGKGQIYLVVLRQLLVAQDIALTIAEFDATARVIVASDMAQAMAQIGKGQREADVCLAFVDIALAAGWAADAHPDLAQATPVFPGQMRRILVGDGAAPPHLGICGRLDTPFTTAQVLSVLHRFAKCDGTQHCLPAFPT